MSSSKSPRYLHVTIVLGDPDADLRAWCYNNKQRRSRAFRTALREWLDKHEPDWAKGGGVNNARAASQPTSPTRPLSGAVPHSSPRPEAEVSLPAHTPEVPAPSTPIPVGPPAHRPLPIEPAPVVHTGEPLAPEPAPVPDEEAAAALRKARLRELISMNEDLT